MKYIKRLKRKRGAAVGSSALLGDDEPQTFKLLRPLHECFAASLVDKNLDEDARRVLGCLVVCVMEENKEPAWLIEQTKNVYRQKYPGMFSGESPNAQAQAPMPAPKDL